MEWISVNKELPDESGEYKVKYKNGTEEKIGYRYSDNEWVIGCDCLNEYVEYWMPLPPPPTD